jgi:two-component system, OmpR family, response regulator
MYRVLVVTSEPVITNKLIPIFTEDGFATAVASDYSEASIQMGRFNPDMVIMDSILPDKDGFEVCSEFRNRFHVPVILLGQDRSDQAWERWGESGADHYEVKPYRYLSLVARVKSILRRYRAVASEN